ncbi:MAG: glycosyltransferase family 4 protein [Pseudomonadota bacterium]
MSDASKGAFGDILAGPSSDGHSPEGRGIVIVAPRNTRFSPRNATSIDLYVHELARRSRYRAAITVFAEAVEQPFEDVTLACWRRRESAARRAARIAKRRPGLVAVHQHLPTAAQLARALAPVPVVLVRHNFVKPPSNPVSAWLKARQLRGLAGIAFVSECCRAVFEAEWGRVAGLGRGGPALFVTPNGIALDEWCPAPEKERMVLFVGRLAPEKGVVEAVEAMGRVLADRPDWRGRFILDTARADPAYAAEARAAIAAAGPAVDLQTDRPHEAVRAEMARAAIALAPTQNAEPFGRVAIEALASGAALVAARAGGLVEAAGAGGLLLETPTAENVAAALAGLMEAPERIAALGAAGRAHVSSGYGIATAAAAFDSMAACLMIKNGVSSGWENGAESTISPVPRTGLHPAE